MLVLTLLVAAAAQGADSPKSVALTRAMRSDEIAVATAKRGFLNGSMDRALRQDQRGLREAHPLRGFHRRVGACH